MTRRIVLFVIIWLALGEVLIRFDASTQFFQSDRLVRIANVYKDSPEKALIDSGRFPQVASDLRVMLLGDSKLYGAGIHPEHRVGALLKSGLRASLHRDGVHLLDLTRPGSNTFYNREAFEEYVESYDPQVVVLAYNHNDVYGAQSKEEEEEAARPAARAEPEATSPELPAVENTRDRILGTVAAVRRVLFKSSVLSLAIVKANMELKLAGFVLPGTEFDHLINRSHAKDFPAWVASQKHLSVIADQCRARGILLMVYLVPELEMLRRYTVFDHLDRYLTDYFGGLQVGVINGVEPFLKSKEKKLSLSRYDGHPNEAAHAIVAAQLVDAVVRSLGEPSSEDRARLRSVRVEGTTHPDPRQSHGLKSTTLAAVEKHQH